MLSPQLTWKEVILGRNSKYLWSTLRCCSCCLQILEKHLQRWCSRPKPSSGRWWKRGATATDWELQFRHLENLLYREAGPALGECSSGWKHLRSWRLACCLEVVLFRVRSWNGVPQWFFPTNLSNTSTSDKQLTERAREGSTKNKGETVTSRHYQKATRRHVRPDCCRNTRRPVQVEVWLSDG